MCPGLTSSRAGAWWAASPAKERTGTAESAGRATTTTAGLKLDTAEGLTTQREAAKATARPRRFISPISYFDIKMPHHRLFRANHSLDQNQKRIFLHHVKNSVDQHYTHTSGTSCNNVSYFVVNVWSIDTSIAADEPYHRGESTAGC
jgi:hypothetical protein